MSIEQRETDAWRNECGTDGCTAIAIRYFEAGDVGTNYCLTCWSVITEAQRSEQQRKAGLKTGGEA